MDPNRLYRGSRRPPPSSRPSVPTAQRQPSMIGNAQTLNMHHARNLMIAPTSSAPGGIAVNISTSGDRRQGTPPPATHGMVITQADHEIYYNQLSAKKRGSPLWIPGPGTHHSAQYRKQGISIGDVGIVTRDGRFDFLFNIFQPANGDTNSRGAPRSFSCENLNQLEIDTTSIYGRKTYLTSESVRTLGNNSSGLRFESTAREAAILTMPDGASTEDLLNKRVIQNCIAKNAESWHEYATGPERGRIIQKGEILGVVVGWDKVRSWGIATSTCTSGQSVSLNFKFGESGTSQAYSWDCTGSANLRVGPRDEEIADLRQRNGAAPQNQCVFVRMMNFTLGGTIVDDHSVAAPQHVPVSGMDNLRGSATTHRSSRGLPRGQGRARGQHRRGGSTSSSSQCSSVEVPSPTYPSVAFDMGHGIVHPSTWLHKHLLVKHPNAKMVITQDSDWISVLTDEDSALPKPEILCTRILDSHEVCENDGIVTLERKPSRRAKSDIIIAVMGPTGAGKSTLINKILGPGQKQTMVSHSLDSCTQEVQAFECLDSQRRRIVLVDSPGFNDTNVSDIDVLQAIADWLKRTYEEGKLLSGLLFLHRISDNRMAASPLRVLEIFKSICGQDAFQNVVLVTTMWDDVPLAVGGKRERELLENARYWKPMVDVGSRMARFMNTAESAWAIISHFQPEFRRSVLLQRELVDERRALAETAAGRSFSRWLEGVIATLRERMQARRSRARHADPDLQADIVRQQEVLDRACRMFSRYSYGQLPVHREMVI